MSKAIAMSTEAKPKRKVVPHIRWMIRRDMPEVCAIERQQFKEFAWDEQNFIAYLRTRNCIGMVAELGEAVHGYMIYDLYRDRLHLRNIAVHPCSLRCGIGSAMIRKLIGKLHPLRRSQLVLEVRETNVTAQMWLRNLGLKAISTLRGFYEETDDDAYQFSYRVPECEGR